MKTKKPKTKKLQFSFRSANADEANLFFALPPEQDEALKCIGHVRIDFGQNGNEFWHTWHPRGKESLNTSEFKAELTQIVNMLRKDVLTNLAGMSRYCQEHGGEIKGGWIQNYGYVVETEHYRYFLRCNPLPNDYHAYLTCFVRE